MIKDVETNIYDEIEEYDECIIEVYENNGTTIVHWYRNTPTEVPKDWNKIEEHHNCTVQLLKNSITNETSVGWYRNEIN